MEFYFNDEIVSLQDKATLLSVMQSKGLADKLGIAVAVNNKVVAKNTWAEFVLNENDRILVISATQGG